MIFQEFILEEEKVSGNIRHPINQTNPDKNIATGPIDNAKTKLPVESEIHPMIEGLNASPSKCWNKSDKEMVRVRILEETEFIISAVLGARILRVKINFNSNFFSYNCKTKEKLEW